MYTIIEPTAYRCKSCLGTGHLHYFSIHYGMRDAKIQCTNCNGKGYRTMLARMEKSDDFYATDMLMSYYNN
jgi:DnaJ-class molecular chaperone